MDASSRDRTAGHGARPPSVLAVTSELPWPLDTGGHLRTFHLLRALALRFRVRLVTVGSAGQEGAIAMLEGYGIGVRPAWARPRVTWREAIRAAAAAARSEPYVLYRRHDRRAAWAVLREEIARDWPDVLYLDHLDSWIYREALPGTPAVIDLHNVYSLLTRRAADERTAPWSRLYLRREADLLGRIERRVALGIEALLAVSEEERGHFAALGARSVHLVPNGVDCAAYEALPAGRPSSPPLILYIGSLSWGPNVSAAQLLATEVLAKVRARVPEARVRIVGRDPSPDVLALGRLPGVEVLGSVPDVLPHLREASLLAVPLEAGGGTRLKILEAFAAGLPVVSTPVGCEGLRASHGEHLVIAHRAEFPEAILALVGDEARGGRLAARARDLVRERYDWRSVGEVACDAVAGVLRGPGREAIGSIDLGLTGRV